MSLQLRCNYSEAAAQVLWEGEGRGRERKKICMQKEEEEGAVHAEWRSKTDREVLAVGRVRKLDR